jgi:hypothetical protein
MGWPEVVNYCGIAFIAVGAFMIVMWGPTP